MANRNYQIRLQSHTHGLTVIDGNCVIDSGQSAGVRSLKGTGVKAVTKVATGIYKIQLEDSFPRYMGGNSGFVSSYTGNTAVTAIAPGTMYIIRTLGSTTQALWEAAGVPSGVVAAPGLAFLCAATSTGSGTCFTQVSSGVSSVEIMGDPNLSVISQVDPHFFIQTLGPTGAALTALIPVAPVDNSVLGFKMYFRNSTIKAKGE